MVSLSCLRKQPYTEMYLALEVCNWQQMYHTAIPKFTSSSWFACGNFDFRRTCGPLPY